MDVATTPVKLAPGLIETGAGKQGKAKVDVGIRIFRLQPDGLFKPADRLIRAVKEDQAASGAEPGLAGVGIAFCGKSIEVMCGAPLFLLSQLVSQRHQTRGPVQIDGGGVARDQLLNSRFQSGDNGLPVTRCRLAEKPHGGIPDR